MFESTPASRLAVKVYEVGARCAGPNDPATIKKHEDIETSFPSMELFRTQSFAVRV
jgi:hypothetical protein